MSDRHHATYRPGYGTPTPGHTYPPPPRSPTFPTPARSSMPSSIGYTSMYAGDMHILPSAAAARYPSAAVPRAGVHGAPPPSSSVPPASSGMSPPGVPSSVPTTTTRTYAVGHDPRGRPSVSAAVPHEPIPSSRSRRSATIDSSTSGGAARPPPVIVTTTRGAHPSSSSARSPVRANPRVSDAHLYAAQTQQPSSSSRSHSHHRHHRHSDADQQHPVRSSRDRDLDRERERTDAAMAARDADAYRSARPAVIYSSDPRHSSTSAGTVNGAAPGGGATTTINYGDDGYHYTNAGEMARYDLDHPGPRHNRHRRTESLDHGYYRPNVSYNANQRSINVNTSDDMSRNYASNTGRLYNGGVRTSNGPPPSTRGFDRINRAYGAPVATGSAPGPSQSSPVLRDVPPAAPVPPSPTVAQGPQQTSPRTDQTTAPPPAPSSGAAVSPELREPRETRDARRGRPVSLYQTAAPRSSHNEDFYRSREDEREMRQARDRTRSRSASHFRDEGVSTRGFGIRPPSPSARDDRRRRDPSREQHRERRESDAEGPSRLRDKVTRGVGIAAAAMGLSASPVEAAVSSAADDDDDNSDGGTRTSRRRKESSPREDSVKPSRPRPRTDSDRPSPKTREARRADVEEDEEVGGSRVSPEVPSSDKARDSPRTSVRLDREKPAAAEAREGSNSDTSDRTRQRRASRQAPRPSGTFDPNDASDISKLREQLAGIKTDDGEDAKPSTSKRQQDENEEALESSDYESGSSAMATPPSRSRSPSRRRRWSSTGGDDEASTALVSTSGSSKPERSVRVVSPPRDKRADDKQPLKGILKQPKPSFPEEDSYPREGVALHKEDRRAKEVPPGARWTKIGRKFVNPEALTIGKERFEVRDDSVIVLRVLSKEEIQAYATATQQLRERRRGRNRDYDHDYDGERDGERDRDRDREHERDYDRDYDDRYDDRDRDREREKDRGDRDRDRGRRRRPRVEHYDDHDYDEYESARWPGV